MGALRKRGVRRVSQGATKVVLELVGDVSRHAGDEDGRKGAWRTCGALRSAPAKPSLDKLSAADGRSYAYKPPTQIIRANLKDIKSLVEKAYGGHSTDSLDYEYG